MPRSTSQTTAVNGWRTCSRGHKFRGVTTCPKCWPGGARSAKRPLRKR